MKLILSFILLLLSAGSFAQLTEGKITYSIYMDSDNDETNKAEDVIAKSTLELSFSGNKTKSFISSGDDLTMATVLDSDNSTGIFLMTGMLGNVAIVAEYDEILGERYDDSNSELELLESTKKILGYKCTKARLSRVNGTTITYWYTTDIKFNKTGIENFSTKIPGVPLKMNIETDGIILTYEAKEVIKKLSSPAKAIFSTAPPVDFKVITIQQFEAGEF